MEKLETQADVNKQNVATASWTLDKLTGRGKYATESKQQALPVGLLNQLAQAALATWRAIPPPNSVGTSLSKIIQGTNEPYAQFVGRLLEAAERILGENSTDDVIVKQLAFENANSACKAALRGKMKTIDLNGMIRLCNDVDSFEHKLSKSINLATLHKRMACLNRPCLGYAHAVSEGVIGSRNVAPSMMPLDSPFLQFRETGKGPHYRAPTLLLNRSLRRRLGLTTRSSILVQPKPLQSNSRERRIGPLFLLHPDCNTRGRDSHFGYRDPWSSTPRNVHLQTCCRNPGQDGYSEMHEILFGGIDPLYGALVISLMFLIVLFCCFCLRCHKPGQECTCRFRFKA
ncbi:uncharacterized protein [Alexandromys fortis]|uniref:uncharacterized protein n=1 Tax=Alexandromys fortis TaxID=100897 RepID=UPI00215211DD|nr:uncharacterized protein LOC126495472 [Microtus fortis]